MTFGEIRKRVEAEHRTVRRRRLVLRWKALKKEHPQGKTVEILAREESLAVSTIYQILEGRR